MDADEELGVFGRWRGRGAGCESEVLFQGWVRGAVEPGLHCLGMGRWGCHFGWLLMMIMLVVCCYCGVVMEMEMETKLKLSCCVASAGLGLVWLDG